MFTAYFGPKREKRLVEGCVLSGILRQNGDEGVNVKGYDFVISSGASGSVPKIN